MRDTCTRHFPRAARLCLTLVVLGLAACASEPQKEPEPEAAPVAVAPTPMPVVPDQVEKASQTLPPSSYSAQFLQADQLLSQNQWMAASEVIDTIPAAGLNASDQVYLTYLRARIDYIRGRHKEALGLLDTLDSQGVNPTQRYRILNLRRHILEMSGSYLESARLGDEILRLAPATDAAALQRAIWRDLQRVSTAQLEQALPTAADPQWQKWLELALLTRAPLPAQLQSLPAWAQSNPQHPAANPLPGGLGYLLTSQAPQKVALILPLSDRLAPAGRAVRDGYLASYYEYRQQGGADLDILILDQGSYGSASDAYGAAVAQGATLVVGPLSKEAVANLAARADRPVPVLALNRLDGAEALAGGSSALVQFALAPEDEAREVAELAFGKGARNALIMRPQGEWGGKVEQALTERWRQLGGTIINSVTYAGREDYSSSVKAALDLPASEQRAQAVKEIFGGDLEFNARRRQDVDVVFLLSGNAVEARSLKPLLAFHYAGTLPVYATSSIYSGTADPRDRDLDGINFVEVPWLLGANAQLKNTISAGKAGPESYTRLHALGADAFLLQLQFRQLQGGADALLRGNTGLLSMDPQLQIHRELVLATFDDGAAKPQ